MRKSAIAFLIALVTVFAVGCNKNKDENAANPQESAAKVSTPLIGVAKVLAHPALDAVEQGIQDVLAEKGVNVSYDFQNANGDINTAASIATKFKADKVDLMVGIGTPIAVALANAVSDKPIIFSAITDPVSAHLVETLDHGYKNITGAVDTIPVKEQLTEFQKIYPFKKLGFIYTSSESNSVSTARDTEAACKEMGIEFIPATISNTSEVKQAAESLVGRVDAFYAVNDNALMAGVNALTATAEANKIPVFGANVITFTEGGAVYAMGFDYYNLGRATGEMIIDVLNGKQPSEIPVLILKDPKDYEKLVDLDAAANLGLSISEELVNSADYVFENGTLKEKNTK
ncbi:MAG: ABC transporter substrate-binding protein [Deferribacterales bacterium]|nr:ABC transporter substrate-binding protein [Deferribacterales bacterium]